MKFVLKLVSKSPINLGQCLTILERLNIAQVIPAFDD